MSNLDLIGGGYIPGPHRLPNRLDMVEALNCLRRINADLRYGHAAPDDSDLFAQAIAREAQELAKLAGRTKEAA